MTVSPPTQLRPYDRLHLTDAPTLARRVRLPLRIKIAFPYLLLAIMLAVAAVYVVTNVIYDSIAERFSNQLVEASKLSSAAIVAEENRLLGTLRLLAHTSGMVDAIRSHAPDQVRRLAYPVILNAKEDSTEVFDADGNLVLALRHVPEGLTETYDFTQEGGAVLTALPFVQAVFQEQVDALGDKYAGVAQTAWGSHLYVAGPIYDDQGQLAGVILVGRLLPTLVRQVREATLAQVTIYSFDGNVLASTFAAPSRLDANASSATVSQQDSAVQQRGLEISDIAYAEVLSAWEIRDGSDIGLIGVALPQSVVVRTSQLTRVQVLAVVTLALLLILLIGWYVARRITIPLLDVVRASAEVANGNLTVEISSTTGDEVELLADSFNHMITNLRQSRMELLLAYDTTLAGWSKALDLRDQETEGHTQRVTELTVRLARAMGVAEDALVHIRRGSLLHDIGKMGIPDRILLKPGPLTDAEWAVMHRHPEYARNMLAAIDFLAPAMDIPYCHHERWDGSGYPRGLKGDDIPRAARIFAVADVWDALNSDRPYRMAWPEGEVRVYLESLAGVEFEPAVVETFLELVGAGQAAADPHPAADGSAEAPWPDLTFAR